MVKNNATQIQIRATRLVRFLLATFTDSDTDET